uniref:Uncharacterized protein TCIL3000_11_14850 n=1 Tax=Trypanosoma congolense (strain IL3000) TaxID=1068625 RepID=G0V2U6_TRYCI|nr:unnamed protein product [Trypanosoma congolense IL3000]
MLPPVTNEHSLLSSYHILISSSNKYRTNTILILFVQPACTVGREVILSKKEETSKFQSIKATARSTVFFFFGMRLSGVLFGSLLFRPHIHRNPCVVCSSAVVKGCDMRENRPHTPTLMSSTDATPSEAFSGGNSLREYGKPKITVSAVTHTADKSSTKNKGRSMGGTIIERRRDALIQWLKAEWDVGAGPQNVTQSDEYLQRCWKAFCDPSHSLTDSEMEGAVELLDRQCEVQFDDDTSAPNVEPIHQRTQDSFSSEEPDVLETENDAFLRFLRENQSHILDEDQQLRFQRTLLDFREMAEGMKLRFFLCCGTALAAHREGYFIPHDSDIDVGVFYEDLQQSGDAQKAVINILSNIALDGRFVVFDVCGTVEKGLEVRMLHVKTRVAVDLNVYYPPLPEDDGLVSEFGAFVWTATYYEASGTRRHGMYRYRHAPFVAALHRVSFCDCIASSADCGGFLVPPQSYLEECYGHDWRTPRKFTYAEGLSDGSFKNIIDE